LEQVDQFFDVGVSPGDNTTLTHSLSTVIVGPGGKIFRWYPSNEWDPSNVVNDIKQAVAQ
jgi:protein SCO1/2